MAKSNRGGAKSPTDEEEQEQQQQMGGFGPINHGEDGEDESLKQINEVLSANDLAGGTIRLYRRGPTDRSFSYLDKMPISEFDIDYIKKVYGGGDYQGKTYRSSGQIGKPVM